MHINLYKTPFGDIAFPLKAMQIGRKYFKREPWMTVGLLNSSRYKAKFHFRKLKKPT